MLEYIWNGSVQRTRFNVFIKYFNKIFLLLMFNSINIKNLIFLQRYSYVCSYVDSVAPKYYPSGIIFGGTHKIRIIICIV